MPPSGCIIREAGPGDAPALAELHVRTFDETHGRAPSGGPTLALRLGQWQDFLASGGPRFCFIAEDAGGQPVGFANGGPYDEPEPPGFGGRLNKIYVLREHHRRGLGRRLVGKVAERFLEEGITSMLLFGDAASPANNFFEALGAQRLQTPTGAFHGGYGWRDLKQLRADIIVSQLAAVSDSPHYKDWPR
jgi:GNAT superfamily N-acetyltransferase